MNTKNGLNWSFRLKWDARQRMLVPVAERNHRVGKASSMAVLAGLMALGQGQLALADPTPDALPTGGVIAAGVGTISQSGADMVIQQDSNTLITNWNSFNIGANASVTFQQPSTSSIALNRVTSMGGSQIMGRLSGNGQVFLINPAGVVIGNGARIETGGFLASTRDIRDEDFLAGNYRFDGAVTADGQVDSAIIIAGEIDAQYVALIAPKVTNDGTIRAKDGMAALLAGDTVVVHLHDNDMIGYEIDKGVVDALVANRGAVVADNGLIALSAKGAGDLASSVVNQEGLVSATGLSRKGGRIVLTGATVTAGSESVTDASGDLGGGQIQMGGSWQNEDSTIDQAVTSTVASGAVLRADANISGDGGQIVVWSDVTNVNSATRVHGTFSATGGAESGNGGEIETSGRFLDVTAIAVDASATNGVGGVWLLDPNNIEITNADANLDASGSPVFTSSNDTSTIAASTITTQLNAGTSVTVQTGIAGTNSQDGDIIVNAAISKTGGGDATLRLNAHDDIIINGQAIFASAGALNVILNSDFDDSGAGAISLNNDTTISTNGGNLSMVGGSSGTGFAVGSGALTAGITIDATIDSGAGDILLQGRGLAAGGVGVSLLLDSQIRSLGGGNLTITGQGINDTGVKAISDSTNTGNITRLQTLGTGNLTVTGTSTKTASSSSAYGIKFGEEGTANTGIDIIAQNGTITLNGTGGLFNPGSSSNETNVSGVDLQRTSITTIANGNIAITGVGATATGSDGGDRDGINIENLTRIRTGNGTGAGGGITLTGTALGRGEGIDMEDTNNNSIIAGTGGVVLNGTNSTGRSDGLQLAGTINAIGGSIQLTGNGGDGTDLASGGEGLQASQLNLGSTSTTAITITGTAKSGNAEGVQFTDDTGFSTIRTIATGSITITGTGFGTDEGVEFEDTTIESGSGGINITGTATGDDAIRIKENVVVRATAGNITLTGNAGDDAAVFLEADSATSTIETITSGNITITGTNTGTGSDDIGVFLEDRFVVRANSGNILITGTTAGARGVIMSSIDGRAGLMETVTTGNIAINATTTGTLSDSDGLRMNNAVTVQTQTGDITLSGTATGDDGVFFNSDTNQVTVQTQTGGNISITGQTDGEDAIEFEGDAQNTVVSAAGAGTITLSGTTTDTASGSSGIELQDARITANTGAISITGRTGGVIGDGFRQSEGDVQISSTGGGAISIVADTATFTGTGSTISSSGVLNIRSFGGSSSIGIGGTGQVLDLAATDFSTTFSDGFSHIQIGDSTHTGGITIEGATTVLDDLRLVQGNGVIAVNEGLTLSTANDILRLDTNGSSSQGASGAIVATNLLLQGTGNHVLTRATGSAGNNVDNLAANTGSLDFANQDALDITTVDSVAGISATGTVKVVTKDVNDADDLRISQSIATTDTSANAIFLNAGEDQSAAQSTLVAGRADIVRAGGTITTGTGGRATLMTGSIAGGTSIATQISAGQFRYGSDETSTTFTQALTSGLHLIYREAPTLNVTLDAVTSVYGNAPVLAGVTVATNNLVNGDSPVSNVGGTIQSTGSATSDAGSYDLSLVGGATSSDLGYILAAQTNTGGHTITKRSLTLTANDLTKAFDNTPFTGGNGVSGNFINGDTLADLVGTLSFAGSSQGAIAPGTSVITPQGLTGGTNYNIQFVSGNLTIQQPPANSSTGQAQSDASSSTPAIAPPPPPVAAVQLAAPVVQAVVSNTGTGVAVDIGNAAVGVDLLTDIAFDPTPVQVVVYRADAAPVAEAGFQISEPNNSVRLDALDNIDQGFADPGDVAELVPFSITTDGGTEVNFMVEIADNGIVIQPGDDAGAEMSEGQRELVIGQALMQLKQDQGLDVSKIRTVYLKLD